MTHRTVSMALCAMSLALLAACLPAKKPQATATTDPQPAVEQAEKPASSNATITDFTLPTPTGETLSIMSEVRKHQLTILDFWASWCGPCRREMPFMVSLYARYQPKGLGIVGISLDEDADAWAAAISELGITWPQVSDLNGWQAAPAQQFQVNAIPFMVIVDANGAVLAKGLRGEELEQFIAQQLD